MQSAVSTQSKHLQSSNSRSQTPSSASHELGVPVELDVGPGPTTVVAWTELEAPPPPTEVEPEVPLLEHPTHTAPTNSVERANHSIVRCMGAPDSTARPSRATGHGPIVLSGLAGC